MPSAHLQPHDYRPDLDPTISEALSSSDSNDRVPFAELVKGKSGGVGSLSREGSLGPEAETSCPKKPRTTVRKRRISSEVR
jgi:hypothetical protein